MFNKLFFQAIVVVNFVVCIALVFMDTPPTV